MFHSSDLEVQRRCDLPAGVLSACNGQSGWGRVIAKLFRSLKLLILPVGP